ncbi:MAG: DUF1365 domain-containing protein [Acidobacteria bacterium]|nr:DUF1365 domain-containing protein [Acidobacteriota bacterium]
MTSCLYDGYVRHRRRGPRVHTFRYRLCLFYLDLDELPQLDRTVRLFSVNGSNAVAFHDRDHLDGRGGDTAPRVAAVLRNAGVRLRTPKVYLLAACRILGYVFNPISLYYCHEGPGGPLRAVVAEVNNTFGERHLYVLRHRLNPASDTSRHAARYRAPKALFVSPFLAADGHYDFHLAPVGPRLSVGILQYEGGHPTLDAQFWGRRVELTSRSVAGLVAARPLAAVKTIAAIHAEALRLWWKGIPLQPRPPRRSGALALRVTVDDDGRSRRCRLLAAAVPVASVPAAPPASVPAAAPAASVRAGAAPAASVPAGSVPTASVPAAAPAASVPAAPAASVPVAPLVAGAVPAAAIAEDEHHAS